MMVRSALKKAKEQNKSWESSFDETLLSLRKVIRESEMFKRIEADLLPHIDELGGIRCLAIGSFSEDQPARYQLALLIEILNFLELEKNTPLIVSIYDPLFSENDLKFIEGMGCNWKVEGSLEDKSEYSKNALFLLPHAPLDLTEEVLKTERPRYFLANHIVTHTDRYTKSQLFEKYPVLCKLVHLLDQNSKPSEKKVTNSSSQTNNNFTTVTSKKKRRKSKYVLQEPNIDYDSIECPYGNCHIVCDFEAGSLLKDKPWVNAFSDLTLHLFDIV
ncbi:hypothetical protein KAFR_0A05720 [Kazachstania africana CBS 2517]|uniref:SRR1-like domain-containing protein n=1 Tax=Kazachstania africana (strain ATCC 22294 / BCRC 22015 / CBS 2517 / CECT 1963 / NBRC 1671 / NRRL Y-8276) TaxID=1071382 RepID=H2ANQ7_KAZAF|nr:hypothetical protein KAFR_0A05720 [Kazachstania africana CBS 2517]CCF56007.1 hypothetical protein KAFR_0A05720 [Kazachstania africana CBS 2517]